MSNITDIDKFRKGKQTPTPSETEGNYLTIVLGECSNGEDVILVEQVEVDGTTTHKDRIILTVDMLHSLIEELIVAATLIEEKE
tara:strand:+ start:25 stop:276 length:252 start_codon:yes stop_codon:yes gene_type:complete